MTYLLLNQLKQYEDEEFVSPINIFSKDKAKEFGNQIEHIEGVQYKPSNFYAIYINFRCAFD